MALGDRADFERRRQAAIPPTPGRIVVDRFGDAVEKVRAKSQRAVQKLKFADLSDFERADGPLGVESDRYARAETVRQEVARRLAPLAAIAPLQRGIGLLQQLNEQRFVGPMGPQADLYDLATQPYSEAQQSLLDYFINGKPTPGMLEAQSRAAEGAYGSPSQSGNFFRDRDPFLAGVVQPAAGRLGAAVGRNLPLVYGPLGPMPATPDDREAYETAGRFIGESAVPTAAWEVTLELIPGIGTLPGVASFGRKALARMLAEEGLPATARGVRELIAKRGGDAVAEALLRGERGALGKAPIRRLDNEWVFHNTTRDALNAIREQGIDAGAFSDEPVDFGGDVWLAVRRGDLPAFESHDYGGVIAHEPAWEATGAVIPPERVLLVNKNRVPIGESSSVRGGERGALGEPPEPAPSRPADGAGEPAGEDALNQPAASEFSPDRPGADDKPAIPSRADTAPGGALASPSPPRVSEEASPGGIDPNPRSDAPDEAGTGVLIRDGESVVDGGNGAGAPPERPSTALAGGDEPPAIIPGEKLRQAIKTAKRLSPEKKAAISAQKSQRVGAAASTLARKGGAGFGEAKGLLAGEYVTPTFEIEDFGPQDIAATFDYLATADWTPRFFDRINAEEGLVKLLNGAVPADHEIALLEKAFPGLARAILDKRGLGPKLWDELVGLLGAPQALQTSFDFSAALRQAAVLGASHPKRWAESVQLGMKAALDDETAFAINEAIYAAASKGPVDAASGAPVPGYGFIDVGGHLSDLGRTAAEREGQFAALNRSFTSRFIEAIPGVRPSQQSYVTTLNKLRGSVYEDVAQQMWDSGVRDKRQFAALANVINHGTGWGDFAPGQITKGLNAFFSPRNLTARFQVVFDPFVQPGSLLKPSARQQAAKNLVGFAGYNAAVLGLLGGMGAATGIATVEMNPLSSDWGKARFGNIRIDLTGGYGPMLRYMARMAAQGKTMTPTGKVVDYPGGMKQLTIDFLRGKLGPVPSLLADTFAGGETFIGEEVDFTSARGIRKEAFNRLVPFFVQDVTDAIREDPIMGAVLAPVAFFGAGVQTYRTPSREAKESVETNGGDFRAALLEAQQAGDEQVANSIISQWRDDFEGRAKERGLTVIPGEKGRSRTRVVLDRAERAFADDGWEPYIAEQLASEWGGKAEKVTAALNGHKTMAEALGAYIEAMLPDYVALYGVTPPVAEDELTRIFNRASRVKEHNKAMQEYMLKFWRENPDLLQEAVDIGIEPTNEAEREILEAIP